MQFTTKVYTFLPAIVLSVSSFSSSITALHYPVATVPWRIPRKHSLFSSRAIFSSLSATSTTTHTSVAVLSMSATTVMTTSISATGGMSSSLLLPPASYTDLMKELDAVQQLSRAMNVLEYDKMVFMPSTDMASTERGKQLAALAAVIHDKATSTKIGELLKAAEEEIVATTPFVGVLSAGGGQCTEEEEEENDAGSSKKSQNMYQQIHRNLELARREYTKKTCIPTELEAKRATLSSEAYTTWAKARQADDFSMFRNVLSQCIDVAIELAKCQKKENNNEDGSSSSSSSSSTKSKSSSLYGIMLDEYEIGMDPKRIDSIFDEIKQALVPLIDRVLGPEASSPSIVALHGQFPIKAQQDLCTKIVRTLGFDDSQGRIDVSVHPFTMSLNPSDVRITSRFRENEWYQGLAAMMHEGGHAIYEQNLGSDSLPMNAALSMGMHESQSLFWERHVGLSRSFWKYASSIVNEGLGVSYTTEDYYGAVNAAARSYIRVEADELTYPLHVILRYGIERDFIDGKLTTEEIPKRWNKDFKDLLGLDVPSDAKGCLQDVHWSMLAYGYFPTYLLGAATAAQLEHYYRIDHPDMDSQIETGNFEPIKNWLTEKVHKHGRWYKSLDEHLEAQLGEKLNPKYYIQYLTTKYTDLYKC